MQDDWCEWLPLAEFAYNNLVNASTGISPFQADGVIQPRFNFIFDHLELSQDKADKLVVRRKQVQDEIDAAILYAQESQAKYFKKLRMSNFRFVHSFHSLPWQSHLLQMRDMQALLSTCARYPIRQDKHFSSTEAAPVVASLEQSIAEFCLS